ncbi:MAG: hypothetical protein ACI9LM_000805 [Alteromonadaceae bacterium]|jgi:hypothetical protein
MTPEITEKFNELKMMYGPAAVTRLEGITAGNEKKSALQVGCKVVLPNLSTTPWLEPEQFPEFKNAIAALEHASTMIKAEIHAAMAEKSSELKPYSHYIGHIENWTALYLYKNGEKNIITKTILPETYRILEQELEALLCPLSEMHVSILAPGVKIPAHNDMCNFAVNLHLAVDIPELCNITVANETRTWQEGKCLMFDYSYLHHAQNNSDKYRICLLMDLWHPGVTDVEREGLVFLVRSLQEIMADE